MHCFQAEKESKSLERKAKDIETEIAGMNAFIKHNNSSFIATVRPKLLVSNVTRYKGKDGNNNLQRDIRLIKIATGGQIPTAESKESFHQLIEKGKAKLAENEIDVDMQEQNTQSDLEKCIGKQTTDGIRISTTSSKNCDVNANGLSTPISNPYYPMYMQSMFGYSNYPYGNSTGNPYGSPSNVQGFPSSPFSNFPSGPFSTFCGFYDPANLGSAFSGSSQSYSATATANETAETFVPSLPNDKPPEYPSPPPE
jgi:hypothetical protein